MTKRKPKDLGGDVGDDAGGLPSRLIPPEPLWAVVRATVHRPGLKRDEYALVDLTDPVIQNELRHTWIVVLPADQQPELET